MMNLRHENLYSQKFKPHYFLLFLLDKKIWALPCYSTPILWGAILFFMQSKREFVSRLSPKTNNKHDLYL